MGLFNRWRAKDALPQRAEPRFGSLRAEGDHVLITSLTDGRLEDFIRGGRATNSGAYVTEHSALAVAVAWRCASIICGVVSSLPWDLMLREGENTRSAAVNHPFREVLTVKPNNRQTPAEFTSMLQLHKLQKGDGFAMKIASRGRIIALWPLDPNRMQVIDNADNTLTYRYSRRDGMTVDFAASEIMHIRGLSWDGVRGLSVIRYMAEAVGMSVQTQKAAAKLFKNGQFRPGYIINPKGGTMSDAAYNRLQSSLDEDAGVDSEAAGKTGILEEGFEWQETSMSAADAKLIELMGFTRTDVGMFYGVPPHLYGDTDKSTSWGTGIEQQNLGFLQYTINPHLTAWKQTYKRDCLSYPGDDDRLYVHVDLKGFLQADAAGRAAYLAAALGGSGNKPWMKQNEARAAEDLPPATEAWANVLAENGGSPTPDKKPVPANDGTAP